MTTIKLRSCKVVEDNPEWVMLAMDTEPLTPREIEVLDKLFPDLESAVERLLAKQAVLNCVL